LGETARSPCGAQFAARNARTTPRPWAGCEEIPFACRHPIAHIGTGQPNISFVAGELRSMIKNDIVALLPDLRAFSRFLCRERESADDLVQNTILAALDKQEQFTPGTNLKGWLFTIMRNRFYSDLRTQRRRPTSIDTEAAPNLAAVDNPEATLALKELASELFELSPQSREALVLVGAGGFSYEEAAALCGCSVGTLKARVSRARKLLSTKLG
jgi:RNA polymerase sigma-70 factor (ECF subfamily)